MTYHCRILTLYCLRSSRWFVNYPSYKTSKQTKTQQASTNFLLSCVIANLDFPEVKHVCVMCPFSVKSSSFLMRQKWVRTIHALGELTFSLLTLTRQVTSNTIWGHLRWCVQTGNLRTQSWPLSIRTALNHNPISSHNSVVLVDTIKHESTFLFSNCVTSEPHVQSTIQLEPRLCLGLVQLWVPSPWYGFQVSI